MGAENQWQNDGFALGKGKEYEKIGFNFGKKVSQNYSSLSHDLKNGKFFSTLSLVSHLDRTGIQMWAELNVIEFTGKFENSLIALVFGIIIIEQFFLKNK